MRNSKGLIEMNSCWDLQDFNNVNFLIKKTCCNVYEMLFSRGQLEINVVSNNAY